MKRQYAGTDRMAAVVTCPKGSIVVECTDFLGATWFEVVEETK